MKLTLPSWASRPSSVGICVALWTLGLTTVWNLASPLGSSPDEPAHLIRAAAVVRGDWAGPPAPEAPQFWAVEVPAYVAHANDDTCMAFDGTESAGCQTPLRGDASVLVATHTSAALNSPLLYGWLGLPTLFATGDLALYLVREMGGVLFSALIGLAVWALRSISRGPFALAALAVALTPMTIYLAAVGNPNGIEVGATLALLSGGLAATARGVTRAQRARFSVAIAVACIALLSARTLAGVWLVLAAAVIVAMRGWRASADFLWSRAALPVWAAGVLAGGSLLAWFAWVPRYDDSATATPSGAVNSLFTTLLAGFDYAEAYVGLFGWVDTPAPSVATTVYAAVAIPMVAAAAAVAVRAQRRAIALLAAALVALPPLLQAALASSLGQIWQGRYTLVVAVMAVLVAGFVIDDRVPLTHPAAPPRWIVNTALAAIGYAQVFTVAWVLRRFMVGSDAPFTGMFTAPEWTPPGGVVALLAATALLWVLSVVYVSALWTDTSTQPGVTERVAR